MPVVKTPIEIGNSLIEQGRKLGDQNLIKMGQEILNKNTKKEDDSNYIFKIRENDAPIPQGGGEDDKSYTHSEPLRTYKNQYVDNLKEGNDRSNEILKKFTKFTPRKRESAQKYFKLVKCIKCNKEERVHPIHAAGEVYRCNRCILKR